MALQSTIDSIKLDLRISHSKLDESIGEQVDACIADLTACGVKDDESDSLILNAVKLWCRANLTDVTSDAEAYLRRYDSIKAFLMHSSRYKAKAVSDL